MERNDVGQTPNQEGIVPGILCRADVAAAPKGDDVPQGDDIAAGAPQGGDVTVRCGRGIFRVVTVRAG